MADAAAPLWIDHATYAAMEREADEKHEWFDGRAYAMAGGTIEHGQLCARIVGELLRLADRCGCTVLTSDVKVRVLATGLATYPDASMVCGAVLRDPDDAHAVTNPTLLVEVLSDGTESYDRDEKFAHYRRIDSLRDYVLVSQHKRQIDVYSREADGRWVLTVMGAGEAVALASVEGSIEVDRVYAGVALQPRAPRGAAR